MIKPVLALVAWSMVMLIWLYVRRLPSLVRYALSEARLHSGEAVRRLPPQVQWSADNYNNLMQQPTLFYALCLGIHISGMSNLDLEYLAWLYVALRVLHSVVQSTSNITTIRFCLFLASSGVLGVLCVRALMLLF
ncbi:MAPEG family protein [Asticcacaulis sp. EMRT-3]|uniref:MAPEG family protein n=1 Tax=Asticcacaulis sp. EMRT-3 TaxID=3040349 RepID=UPI0024AEDD9E|nr:MAPEG family protein [Asticcacaulis sp. EMRT-3]MDI7775834.1 MAPEG family protein [Asticcacaulis sp. EMRT-3]